VPSLVLPRLSPTKLHLNRPPVHKHKSGPSFVLLGITRVCLSRYSNSAVMKLVYKIVSPRDWGSVENEVRGVTTLSWNCVRTSSRHTQFLGEEGGESWTILYLRYCLNLVGGEELVSPGGGDECAVVGWMQGGGYERQIRGRSAGGLPCRWSSGHWDHAHGVGVAGARTPASQHNDHVSRLEEATCFAHFHGEVDPQVDVLCPHVMGWLVV